ncbi:MAG: PAS domain-containing protein [Rubrivivax sp.]|nr:PAS domain-containing protein [Rubrivivax sp.]
MTPTPADPGPAGRNEAERLASLERYGVLDSGRGTELDDLTALAAAVCGTPIALVSLVDSERQWFKSRIGLDVAETPRALAFCDHAIRRPGDVLVVPDTRTDPRFADNPLVCGPPHIRFYAGAPLVTPDGHALGTLSVLDREPRELSAAQRRALVTLSHQVMSQLELQRQARELKATLAQRDADLLALRTLQDTLAEREQRLARVTAHVPGVVFQYCRRPDGSSFFGYASEGLREIYRMAPEDLREDASAAFALGHPDDLPRVIASIESSARDLTPWDCEYRVRFGPGDVRWLHGRSMPERLPDGSTQWHGFISDITERKAAEQMQRERETVLLQAQRLAKLGSWRWSGATRRSEWSEQTCRLFGVDPAQRYVTDEAFMRFVHPDDRDRVMQMHLHALAGRQPYDVEYRAITPEGRVHTLHARAEVVRDGEGEVLTMVGTLLDVTERVAAEAELTRHRDHLEGLVEERTRELIAARDAAELASRAKGEFLSSMSHELRTPMNAILGFSQLLELDRGLDTRAAGYVREILRAGHHLLTLINEVLDLARIESGRMSLSPEALPLAELVQEAETLVRPLAQQHDVTLTVEPLPGLVVRADRLRLKQVLLNLLSNAVKYNRTGGSVQVRAQARDMFTVRISVIDTGIGIAAQHLPQLFQPFSRVGGSSAEGTGIGLSISERLVRLMGGQIGVHSQPGMGSEFWVDLPSDHLAETPPPRDTAFSGAPTPRPGRSARVLYVEDNPANLKLVEMIVQRHPGVELQMAPTGSLGLDLARGCRPDLLLLDIHLPDIDGYQVLARLRADPATRTLPVVAVTAQAMPDDVKRVLAAGFDGYLAKPLDLARFDALLEQMLEPRRNTD